MCGKTVKKIYQLLYALTSAQAEYRNMHASNQRNDRADILGGSVIIAEGEPLDRADIVKCVHRESEAENPHPLLRLTELPTPPSPNLFLNGQWM